MMTSVLKALLEIERGYKVAEHMLETATRPLDDCLMSEDELLAQNMWFVAGFVCYLIDYARKEQEKPDEKTPYH